MVEFVEPDTPVEVEAGYEVSEAVHEIRQDVWGHDKINLGYASFTGNGVHIYVMDTGIRTTHQDFSGRAVPTVDTIQGGGVVKECVPGGTSCASDSHGHGTHVA